MTELSEKDLNSITHLHDIWIAKELEGRAYEVIDLCSDDVRWLPPDASPILGKEEIEKYLATQDAKLLGIDAIDVSVQGSGSLAYLISNYTTSYLIEAHSEIPHQAKGTHLWILRKERDDWRVVVVTWSSW